jgi:hypothetical protein
LSDEHLADADEDEDAPRDEDDVWGVLGACEVRLVCDGDAPGVVTPGLVPPPAPDVGSLPSEAAIFTVRTSSTMSTATDPMRTSRRRQYTDGGCDPTGENMSTSR